MLFNLDPLGARGVESVELAGATTVLAFGGPSRVAVETVLRSKRKGSTWDRVYKNSNHLTVAAR